MSEFSKQSRFAVTCLFSLICALQAHAQSALTPLISPAASAVGCFIQTDFVAAGKNNFELSVLEGSNAVHYWRANDTTDTPWHKGDIISSRATGPGCLLQSDFMSSDHGNLEAVIPEAGGTLVHYWRDSGNSPSGGWNRTGTVTTGITGGVCFITSDYLADSHRNFEVMVQKGDQLWHYWHIAGAPFDNWPGEQVTAGVTSLGPGCMIQSDYQAGGHRNLEVVVQKGSELWHHWHWAGIAAGLWPGKAIVSGVTAPGCLISSDYTANKIRNFELLVQKGDALWHYWRWDGITDGLWPGAVIVNPVSATGCLLQSSFTAGAHANFEVVAPTAVAQPNANPVNEVVHYFQVQQASSPWQRAQTVSFQGRSEKVCQLTSDFDWETGATTTTQTQKNAGLGAVDLGYPVEHQGRLMLLFGDSWPTQVAHPGNEFQPKDDAVGWIASRTPPTRQQCTDMIVNSVKSNGVPVFSPATVTGQLPVAQGYFNVPTGGISDGKGVTAFFWTNHCSCPNQIGPNPRSPLARPSATAVCETNPNIQGCPETDQLNSIGMGVMARSVDNGFTFTDAVLMPTGFVYATAVQANIGDRIPLGQGLGTYVFAVPRYRASAPYLAYAPPGLLGDPSSWQFFIGRKTDGSPLWASEEVWLRGSGGAWKPPGSAELFDTDRCIGEFSISWNKPLGVWLMLYNCGGIVARTASHPWGPWSASTEILSPDKDGAPCRLVMTDHGCGNQQRYHNQKKYEPGGLYAPFVLDRYTTRLPASANGAQRARIYWTVSTWDPYQVSIMRTDLEVSK